MGYIKGILKWILEKIKIILTLNNKYKIKLITMIICIGGTFIFTLIYIIHTKSTTGFEPLLVNINETSLIGKITQTGIFKNFSRLLFGYWNLGRSYETLLGLIILTTTILIILIIGSSYIKILFIPLTMLTTFIFYNLYKVISKNYQVTNTELIFDKFGIILQKNVKVEGLEFESLLEKKINFCNDFYLKILQDKNYDSSKIDLLELKKRIIELGIKDESEIGKIIVDYFKNTIIIHPEEIVNNTLWALTNNYTMTTIVGSILVIVAIGFVYYKSEVINEFVCALKKETISLKDETDIASELVINNVVEFGTEGDNSLEITKSVSTVTDLLGNHNNVLKGLTIEEVNFLKELFAEFKINETNPAQFMEFLTEYGLKINDIYSILREIRNK